VLTEPRFQQNKLDLHREKTIAGMKQRNDDSSFIEAREREFVAYGEKFWACRYDTESSVKSITPDDLHAFHQKWFHPANFVVSASGDFDRADMIARLEALFGNWPFTGERSPPIPTETQMKEPGLYLVDKDVNQGRVSIMLPGVLREDPDYPAIMVMNDILGGGGFTSRLINRVRSDEGLAYDAGSAFTGGVYFAPPFAATFQSKSRTVAFATQIMLDEMKKMTAAPVTDEELVTSKKSFIDTFPQHFASKSQTANTFATDEFTGRFQKHPDFYQTWRSRIDAVSTADIQRVAQKHLHPDQVRILVVGQKEEILKGHPEHASADLKQLTGGRLKDVPLRDPLTMKPVDKKETGVQ
jgi:predicted Zn-dependent peptidase